MINVNGIDFLIYIVGGWRLSLLIQNEIMGTNLGGPFGLFNRVRQLIVWLSFKTVVRYDKGVSKVETLPTSLNWIYEASNCIYCASIWVGIFITLLHIISPKITKLLLLPFTISGVAIIITTQRGE